MEEILIDKINQCLKNENFKKLPIFIIHRLIERSKEEDLSNDLLYEFISESIESRFVLFAFLKIQNLSENNFNDFYVKYLENSQNRLNFYYQYLPSDVMFIKSLKEENNQLKNEISSLRNEKTQLEVANNSLQNQKDQLENERDSLRNQKDQLENERNSLQNQKDQLENERDSLRNQNNQLANERNSLRNQKDQLENERDSLQNQNNQLENERDSLRNQKNQLANDKLKWINECSLSKSMKSNDDNCFIKIIENLLSNMTFSDENEKSEFIKNNILTRANESGTSDLVNKLRMQNIINTNSRNITCFLIL